MMVAAEIAYWRTGKCAIFLCRVSLPSQVTNLQELPGAAP
jgi:hypothetical protein